ncbi:MAG: UvrABC system protein B [Parcubacteria group bacterium GW2011_GWB1_45_9]|nr:MAG: UvrABC system protein B [Parcubacteria group bacterium GW2011_GWB1_45_9]
MNFKLISQFKSTGDQAQAVEKLVSGLENGHKRQVLLGITGSGKTFSMSQVIEKANLPALVISPNKTLAAQLYHEFKTFFPQNAVHYFVSYYDYYQPEAYIPATDTYIQKDARINAEIDKLRHAALQSLFTRKDAIIVASVSCIYGLGDPSEYRRIRLQIRNGQKASPADLIRHLNFLQYQRTAKEPSPGEFHLSKNGKELLIHLVTGEKALARFSKNKIISLENGGLPIDILGIYPAKFWIAPKEQLRLARRNIKTELDSRVEELQAASKFEEAERLEKRVKFDLVMLMKAGYVNGVENYSRHLSFREEGEPPFTLLDYFPRPFLTFVDESHIGMPQLKGMYCGDRQRKQTLVDYGFRLPSALDNRPLNFDEFNSKIDSAVFVSATPGEYETELSDGHIAEQLTRPTGILDPILKIKPAKNQVKDLVKEIETRVSRNERVLALTLTKRSAEDLAEYLLERNIKTHYLHSEIKTLRRMELLNDLRRGEVDVIVGINLLREGLDLPEVSLVAILDADREGFLRNYRSLMQMAGRAARSVNGQVILYADFLTDSIKKLVAETTNRRAIQKKHNTLHGIKPQPIQKEISAGFISAA